MLLNVAFVIIAYLFGCISTAIIVCKLRGLPDPRSAGSGNPGATNVLRLGGRGAAAATLVGDMLKGVLPVLAVTWLQADISVVAATGVAAFLGHLYPVYYGFKGGKGVATALGVLFGFSWWVGLLCVATWLAVAALTRISSLSGLISMLLAPAFVFWLTVSVALGLAAMIMSVFIYWRHRSNIRALLSGTEPHIGQRDG